ncbi:hypothetical protein C8R43DRAFT_984081 [Mycena crocata]|nr:hypothetical protein C8R43DRAFT_984081 [Mycena crocata]
MQAAFALLQQLEESVESVASNSPTTQIDKVNLRRRLLRVAGTLPAEPPSSRAERASSEPPPAAQPPRPPPPLKPSSKHGVNKEVKTERCLQRVAVIVGKAKSIKTLNSKDFYTTLTPPKGKPLLIDEETLALAKLLVPYADGSIQSWRDSLGKVDLRSISVNKFLQGEQRYEDVADLPQRLLLRHKNLVNQETMSDISTYLRNLLQCINAIQYSLEVKKLGDGKGGTGRKTALYNEMYKAEGSPGTYAGWKKENEAKVTARNRLCMVYHTVRGSFPFHFFRSRLAVWSQSSVGSVLEPKKPRTKPPRQRFGETLLKLQSAVADDGQMLTDNFNTSKGALYNMLMTVFPAAANFVIDFCDSHPPDFAEIDTDTVD